MTFSDGVFWVFAAIAVVPALLILVSRSIVRMAFLLLFSLAGFAGLYLNLGAGFVGFTQVLVYIGGILILFLFGVMLTHKTDIFVRDRGLPGLTIPGFFAGLLLMGALLYLALQGPWKVREPAAPGGGAAAAATAGAAGPAGAAGALGGDDSRQIGMKLLSTYILPFEAVSILLLAAMVGATYIARAQAPGAPAGEAALEKEASA